MVLHFFFFFYNSNWLSLGFVSASLQILKKNTAMQMILLFPVREQTENEMEADWLVANDNSVTLKAHSH